MKIKILELQIFKNQFFYRFLLFWWRRVVHTLYFQVNVGTLVNQLAHLYEGAFVLSAYTVLNQDFVVLEGERGIRVADKSPTIAGRVFNVAAN